MQCVSFFMQTSTVVTNMHALVFVQKSDYQLYLQQVASVEAYALHSWSNGLQWKHIDEGDFKNSTFCSKIISIWKTLKTTNIVLLFFWWLKSSGGGQFLLLDFYIQNKYLVFWHKANCKERRCRRAILESCTWIMLWRISSRVLRVNW